MTKRNSDFTLPTLDDLFTTQAERDDAKLERVKNIPLDELHPFKNHPFKILNNEEMERMIESMKQKYYLALSIEEWRLMLVALNTFRNRLISEGRYTDAVDEVLIKVANAKAKKFKILTERRA